MFELQKPSVYDFVGPFPCSLQLQTPSADQLSARVSIEDDIPGSNDSIFQLCPELFYNKNNKLFSIRL